MTGGPMALENMILIYFSHIFVSGIGRVNLSKPTENIHHFTDDIFNCISWQKYNLPLHCQINTGFILLRERVNFHINRSITSDITHFDHDKISLGLTSRPVFCLLLGVSSACARPITGAGYFSNLACDWLSIVWTYSEQETENGPWCSEEVLNPEISFSGWKTA